MRTETPQEALKGTQKNFLNGLKYGFEPISMRVSAPRLSTHIPTHLKLRIKIILAIPQFGRLKSAFIVHFDRARTAPRVMLSPMAKFVLVLSRISRGSQVELTCAVTGESEGWLGITRRFASQEEAEEALRKTGAIPPVGPYYNLQAVASGVTTAIFVSNSVATELQVLSRLKAGKKERVMVTFQDKRGGLLNKTAHYRRASPIVVGEVLPVETPLGVREVVVLKILGDRLVPYGSEDTRREMDIETEFY